MSNKKQTAVEWLALQLPIGLRESFSKEIEHAIQMEREQIIDAWMDGRTKSMDRQKLIKQLFVAKVSDIIGFEKAIELLKESTVAIDEMLKSC